MRHALRLLLAATLAAAAPGPTARAAGVPPVSTSVAIDGDVSDWAEILSNPANAARDGEGSSIPCAYSVDRDCAVSTGGDDLARFAWTTTPSFFYYYFERHSASSAWTWFDLYVDTDLDGRMETGEPVVSVRMNSAGSSSTSSVATYAAASPGGDPLEDPQGYADGYTLPGSTGATCCNPFEGPVPGGLAFEGAVAWGDLGVSPSTPVNFHVASASNSNVPIAVADNMAGPGGRRGTTAYRGATVAPARETSVEPGVLLSLVHRACNAGNVFTRLEITGRSLQGRDLTWHLGPSLVVVDAGGDGAFGRPGDSLPAAADQDADGVPDVGPVQPGNCVSFSIDETFPNNASDTTELVTVEVRDDADPTASADLTDIVHVGRIALWPSRARAAAPGEKVLASHALQSNLATSERIDVQLSSTLGWTWAILLDPNGDGRDGDAVALVDTDGTGLPDVGLAPGESVALLARATVPGGMTPGQVETATVRAVLRGSTRGTVNDTVTVSPPVQVFPNHVVGAGERYGAAGGSVYFNHVLRNGLGIATTFQLAASCDLGWPVSLFEDPDCDGMPWDALSLGATSPLVEGGGGEACLIVRADLPTGAPNRQVGRITLTASATTLPSASAQALDDAVVAIVRTYADPLHAVSTTTPPPCSTVHAAANGLPPSNTNLRWVWRDPSGAVVRVLLDATDVSGQAHDEMLLQPGDLGAGWDVSAQLFDGSAYITQDTATFDVLDRVQLRALALGAPRVNVSGASLAALATLQNTSADQTADNTTLRWLVISADRTQYLRSDGTFGAFSGIEATQVDTIPRINPLAEKTRTLSVASVTWPSVGVFTVELHQSASCGGEYLAGSATVEVVDDADFDGLSRDEEIAAGTDPGDADSDDDGLADGADGVTDSDGDGTIDALQCDSDGDGLPDGLEAGAWEPLADTNLAAACFLADAWPGTTTDPDRADTDGGGVEDGVEDADHDGRVDASEIDPNVAADDALQDSDGDTVPDLDETAAGMDPHDSDSDDDGRLDGAERGRDSDGDTLDDAIECDSDGDGLLDGLEVGLAVAGPDTDLAAGCFAPDADPVSVTDPTRADTDLGGVPDGIEDADRDGALDAGETDPNAIADDDTDGDGLANLAEDALGTSRSDRDTDDDGVSDRAEGTGDADGDTLPDALECDADGDGLPDGLELGLVAGDAGTDVAAGCFVPDADAASTTDPRAPDTDGGGVDDGAEDADHDGARDAGETDPRVASDDDTDGDGLPNLAEDALGTSRADRDSDDDGVNDLAEGAGDADGDTTPDALECDADGDGLPDGLELGLAAGDAGTDVAAGCFVADAEPASTTDPHAADTDGGGLADGAEDLNRNGRIDAGETDPNEPLDDGACSRQPPAEVQGLRVTRGTGALVRIDWTVVADPCLTYDAWSSTSLPAVAPVASGILAPPLLALLPTARCTYLLVSARSTLAGAGPTGL